MPAPTKGPRLGGGPAHERLMLANLVTALFEHDSITTTETKAKRMRPLAERMVTFAKRGDLHARRRVIATLKDKGVVHRLFVEIAPDMAERPGGYTRITKIAPRKGDNAPMAVIELVREPLSAKPQKAVVREAEGATKRSAKDKSTAEAAPGADQVAPVQDAPVADLTDTEPVAATKAAGLAATDVPDTTDQSAAVELPEGAVAATADGSAPEGYSVKGNADSGLYHVAGSQWYDATEAEFWFQDAAAAEAAGFKPAGGAAKQDLDQAAPVPFVEAEFGKGSAEPHADGSQPTGFDIKGNKDSMLYHVPASQWYDATDAEVWFDSAEAAEKAGFKPAGGADKQQVEQA